MRSESRMATSSSMTRMRDLGMQAGVAELPVLTRTGPHPRAQQDLFTARGAPPPLALTRRPGFAGLPSGGPPQRGCRVGDPGASLGPQALFTARGARPPLALARRPGFAGLPSGGPPQRGCRVGDPGASLGPQALVTARGARPPLALA